MEKSFIVKKESTYYKDLKKYQDLGEQQRKFVIQFFKEKGIEANRFYVHGDGFINQPFDEMRKDDIRLGIIPEGKDIDSFGKMLTKPDKHELQTFRKNSSIGKEFAQKCVDEKITINLFQPDLRDYFKSAQWQAYSSQKFEFDDKIYLKFSSESLKDDDIPKGFIEIKLSEYYKMLEEYKEKNIHKK